jgi:hypothetical protein
LFQPSKEGDFFSKLNKIKVFWGGREKEGGGGGGEEEEEGKKNHAKKNTRLWRKWKRTLDEEQVEKRNQKTRRD